MNQKPASRSCVLPVYSLNADLLNCDTVISFNFESVWGLNSKYLALDSLVLSAAPYPGPPQQNDAHD